MFWKIKTFVIITILYLLSFTPIFGISIHANQLKHLKQNISITTSNLSLKNYLNKAQITSNVFKKTWKQKFENKSNDIFRKHKKAFFDVSILKKKTKIKILDIYLNDKKSLQNQNYLHKFILTDFINISKNKNLSYFNLDNIIILVKDNNDKNIIKYFINILLNNNQDNLKHSKNYIISNNYETHKIEIIPINQIFLNYKKNIFMQTLLHVKDLFANVNKSSLVIANLHKKYNKRIEFNYLLFV